MNSERHVLVHAHIFKNAGTTFDFSLQRSFGEAFTDHREDARFLEGRNAYLLDYLAGHPGVSALSSHSLHFRIKSTDKIRLHPIYFLRHPLARVWSVYRFEKQQTGVDTEGARRAKEMDLNAYVDWYLQDGSPATIRDIHTIFLSGEGPSPDNMARKFVLASQFLARDRAIFAVVERFDDAMLVIENRLKPMFPELDLAYVRHNVSAADPDQDVAESASALLAGLEPRVADRLQAGNARDMALYRLANAQLDLALAGISDLEGKRADFARRCRHLQSG